MLNFSSIGESNPAITAKLSASGLRVYVGDRMLVVEDVKLVESCERPLRLVMTLASFALEVEDGPKRADA